MGISRKDIPAAKLATCRSAGGAVSVTKNRGPRVGPVMNGLEKAYAKHLELQRTAGLIWRWWFGSFSLKLADGCWYRSDFLVELAGGALELHETKGYMREDARVKIKWVAQAYPFAVVIVRRAEGGRGFEYEQVSAGPAHRA